MFMSQAIGTVDEAIHVEIPCVSYSESRMQSHSKTQRQAGTYGVKKGDGADKNCDGGGDSIGNDVLRDRASTGRDRDSGCVTAFGF